MYERNAIVLERYLSIIFGKNDETNVKSSFEIYKDILEEMEKYQVVTKEEEKVIYNKETDELEYSNSIKIAIEITKLVPKEIKNIDNSNKSEAVLIMKNNYYYLSMYLFDYYIVAIEFGIPPEKQFYAPRTSVLGPISKELAKFYYKPSAIMTISMPQRNAVKQR